MKASRVRLFLLSSLVLILALVSGGCGETEEPSPSAVPFTSPPSTPATTETARSSPTARPTPPVTAVPTPPRGSPVPECTNQATFIADVTIPDGTLIAPGQAFLKTWRLQNSGSCPWSTDYALIFAGGDQMGGPDAAPLPGTVAPGDAVDLSVALTAPAGSGSYSGSWRLRSAKGEPFGLGPEGSVFTVVITVGLPTATPVPATPTATPTPATPTATPSPATPTPTPPVYPHWRGEYFDNPNLSGIPVLVRDDVSIDFDWGNGSPAPVVPADGFSVRWTRTLTFTAGLYRFDAVVDDGVRIYVDDVAILNAWTGGPTRTVTATHGITAGPHALRIEYYDDTGPATIHVSWNRLSSGFWTGEFWANINLSGAPVLLRDDAEIDFKWGDGSPGPGVPSDNFSARWTRTEPFEAGSYRFHVRVDDGARLWVDNQLLIDAWEEGDARELTADSTLTAGSHNLRVEYFATTGQAQIQVWWETTP